MASGDLSVSRPLAHGCPIPAGYMRAPALQAVDQPLALEELICRRDGGSGHAELRGQNTLGGKLRPGEEIVPLDGRRERRGEPPLQWPLTQPPPLQRAAQLQGQPHANAWVIGSSHWPYCRSEIKSAQCNPASGKEGAMRVRTGLASITTGAAPPARRAGRPR